MEHIAIDLGGRKSQVCVRSSDGKILEERRLDTWSLKGYLRQRPKSVVVVETCAEAFKIADEAKALGHRVRVVPATLVKALGVGARRTKTDERDAQVLSQVSCRIELPSVHVPSQGSRDRKTECGMREAQVRARTQLLNTVRGWMRRQGQVLPSGSAETFPKRVREYFGAVKVELPPYVTRQLETIGHVSGQVKAADEELLKEAEQDPVCQKLMTVPGVGPVTAIRFAAALDEVGRFPHAHMVESYLGLVPGQHSSSDHVQALSITKAGSTKLRWALIQAAWVARRFRRDHPMVVWSYGVERRRGKRIATVALARKMVGVLYAIWRDGTTYDETRGARPIPRPTAEEEEERMKQSLTVFSKKASK